MQTTPRELLIVGFPGYLNCEEKFDKNFYKVGPRVHLWGGHRKKLTQLFHECPHP